MLPSPGRQNSRKFASISSGSLAPDPRLAPLETDIWLRVMGTPIPATTDTKKHKLVNLLCEFPRKAGAATFVRDKTTQTDYGMATSSLYRAVLRRRVQQFRQWQRRPLSTNKAEPSSPKTNSDLKNVGAESQIPTPNNVPTLPFWQRLGPFTRAAQAYGRAQRKRPLTTQLCSSLVIYFCSDISAQYMGKREYDPVRTGRSLIIGAISSMPSYKWFVWLSTSFNYPSRLLSLATKVIVNQLCFTPIFNTYFFGMQALLAGENLGEIWTRIKRTVPTSFLNSCKLWPAVTAFSFTFIPLEYRSLFAGVIAVGWQTYLSFLNRQAEEEGGKQVVAGSAPTVREPPPKPLSSGLAQLPLPDMAAPYLRARPSLSSAVRPLTTTRIAARAAPRRLASTSSSPASESLLLARLKTVLLSGLGTVSLYATYYYVTDTRASVHRWIVPPLLRAVYPDAEDAHHAGTTSLKNLYAVNLHPRERLSQSDAETPGNPLSIYVFGTELANPIGISAGLDKDADVPDALFALGAAVVEVGGCTPLPQAGNPRPRVFRVPSIDGMINRYGLNSRGADAMAARLRDRLRKFARTLGLTEQELLNEQETTGIPTGSLQPGKLLLVQIAKNKGTDEKDVNAVIRDYVYCVNRLAPYADVLVVNVSSPNTPGLRDLQSTEPLTKLLSAVVDEANRTDRKRKPKVMVKVSPDEDDDAQMEGVVQAVWTSGVDGVIVGNTTKRRTGLVPQGVKLSGKEQRALMEDGGFSGPAQFDQTLSLVGRYRKLLDSYSLQSSSGESGEGAGTGTLPAHKVIFATGGITNGKQALQVLNAGASVAQVYTGLTYGGPGTITRIKGEMREQLSVKDK
ncbi:hypothetical protein B0H63DRAFT_429364 [Podospora didyma]|uniref:Dihydroorotate dehydrogenase catalytic domain-containing protein n=1 Tax=Podospora didyma TaxID=330526 RepID=A0AAE0NZT9_9PEZI|nr:hypothetical protein B0H63DRAFT_429364 [Podospora didyma]